MNWHKIQQVEHTPDILIDRNRSEKIASVLILWNQQSLYLHIEFIKSLS